MLQQPEQAINDYQSHTVASAVPSRVGAFAATAVAAEEGDITDIVPALSV